MTVREAVYSIFQDTWKYYYSISFVRNPWDRLVSLYFYQKSVDYGIFSVMGGAHQLARSYNFDEWLKLNLANVRKATWFGQPQTDWVDGVSEVFRYEQYEESLKQICRKLEVDYHEFHVNKSSHGHYTEYYKNKDDISRIAEIDYAVIKKYGYKYGE
jgi:hypothetical protein